MGTEAWVAGKLNPYARAIKLAAITVACVGLFAAGWVTNGWRIGEGVSRKEVARQSALNARQADAIRDALEAVTASQAALAAARRDNARLSRAASVAAPSAPQFACRNLPLPAAYLEVFRQ